MLRAEERWRPLGAKALAASTILFQAPGFIFMKAAKSARSVCNLVAAEISSRGSEVALLERLQSTINLGNILDQRDEHNTMTDLRLKEHYRQASQN